MRRHPCIPAALLITAFTLAFLYGCGGSRNDSPMLLESERRLEGMYEECRTIEIHDPLGERPDIDTDEIRGYKNVDVETVLVRSNGMEKPGVWTGARLGDVLRGQGVEEPFVEVRMEAWDGYVARVSYEMAMRPDTILAWAENGAPIPREQGPVRLVVGSEDGFYWIHRIVSMEIVR
ncbi:MAG: molybdopterin-dependent oxidoreductase [Actinobacteria bacterium]|nr:molybdopterin-dependent oxidoreductase [Actinomycetota bacterium]MDI6830280.1 molybdopterin-dependent oxidoreductase [Actinomycetota bacterium]